MAKALTAAQMAEVLGVKRRTVLTWAHKGLIPFMRAGRKFVRFDPDAVTAALRKKQG